MLSFCISGGNLHDLINQQKGKLFTEEVKSVLLKSAVLAILFRGKRLCSVLALKKVPYLGMHFFFLLWVYFHCVLLSLQTMIWYFYQIASAVAHIHKAGILHR